MSKTKFLFIGILIFLIGCGESGNKLSPVNIENTEKDETLMPIFADYLPSDNFVINNTANSIEVYLTGSYFIIPSQDDYQGTELDLEKLVIKSQSEHQVKGKNFPLEIQFHHIDSTGMKVIASTFVESGDENLDFQTLLENIPAKGEPQKIEAEIDPYYLFSQGQNYWKYVGSETEKPYTPNITWYIMQEPITASSDQIQKIKDAIGKNNVDIVKPENLKIIEF